MKVLFLPNIKENPYFYLLSESLKKHGIETLGGKTFPSIGWILKNRNLIDIFHFHFPSKIYRLGPFTWLRFLIVVSRVLFAKILGKKIFWTCHNILPHEKDAPFFDWLFHCFLAKVCNGVIFHSLCSYQTACKKLCRPSHFSVIPHGNFSGVYGPKICKSEARNELGLPQDRGLLMFFGLIRPYKGVEYLIREFPKFEGDLSLLIAGGGSKANLKELKANSFCKDIHLRLGFVPESEVHLYFSAADALVVPYKNITTSGAAILGISYGLPVIAPAIGGLPELLEGGGGILYDPNRPDGLVDAISRFANSDRGLLSQEAIAKAKTLNWEAIGAQTASLYRS